MKTTAAGLLLAALLFSSLPGLGQSYPDLILDGESLWIWGDKYYQDVSLRRGALLAYDPGPRERHVIGLRCNSFLMDASSSIVFGATSFYQVTVVPLSINKTGTPDVIIQDYGVTQGNGAGTYGGRGFNPFDAEKEPYGSTSGFEVQLGSMGTRGESIRIWFGGGWVTIEGRGYGRAGGAISIIGNDVTIEGRINADGETGMGDLCGIQYPGYSGSGGGILIAAKNLTITTTARITANGGEYALTERCLEGGDFHERREVVGKRDGGGGRIKIFYEEGTISPDAVIEAEGWENGTIYIQQVPSIARLMNPGDVNEDGVTNYEDLFLLQQSWQQELTPIPGPEETPRPTATSGP